MIIKDRIYGKHNISSPVLITLINSKSLQRLKGIGQFGIPDEYYHLKNFSRFEHCIGVMLLLKLLGASEEEQIAGLLHDVSHTAFSHVIDWVVGDGKTENYQDEQHKRFIQSSEIPKILEKYGYDVQRITDYHHFGLLERDLPDLCADRVDYSLREFPDPIMKKCFTNLAVKDNKIVFSNKETALLFATSFLKRQVGHWGEFEGVSRYRIFADVLRIALKEGIITKDDFWQEDDFIVEKLKDSNNKQIHNMLKVLRNKSLTHLPKSTITVHKKFRFVDPLFIFNGELVRLSERNKTFINKLNKARRINEKGITVPYLKINRF